MFTLRNASTEDAERLIQIYDYYVKNTAITFEYTTPSEDEFSARMRQTMRLYPYFVALKGKDIVGYAYAGPFSGRAAYSWACETTVYVDCDFRGMGIGKLLYSALETALQSMGITNMSACVAYSDTEDEYLTKNSVDFHIHTGFEKVGHFHKCGYKFGRWYDILWLEKAIAAHAENMPQISAYYEK